MRWTEVQAHGIAARGFFSPPPRRPIEQYFERKQLDFVNQIYARDFVELDYAIL